MICVYIALLLVSIIGVKFFLKGFNSEYISCNLTLSIKGIFVILVFCRHYIQYVTFEDNLLDRLFIYVDNLLGQLIVVMFLFYSGYGIMTQIQKATGRMYIKSFLKHRFLPVWLSFVICICLFIFVNISLGQINKYSLGWIALSFTGWTSIGNSNWYIFDTLVLYLIVYVSFSLFEAGKSNEKRHLILLTLLTAAFVAILFFTRPYYCWNTVFCFPLGMWFRYYKNKIEGITNEHYWISVSLLFLSFIIVFLFNGRFAGLPYIVLSSLFALLVVLFTMKIRIGNSVLNFFGTHVFSIYILQRIPFMIFRDIISNNYLFFIVSFIVTIVLATVFDMEFNRVRKAIVSHMKV